MDHENGQYSLFVRLAFLKGKYNNYCQEAFEAYSNETESPFYSRGDGYDWELAFHKAFEDDPNIKLIEFDCESGGFFCNCHDLDILIDFGHRFKEICEDTERFKPIVYEALENEQVYESNKQRMERTIYSQLLRFPLARFDIKTSEGVFTVDQGVGIQLIKGTQSTITSKDGAITLDSEDFLTMKITEEQRDLLDRNHYLFLAEPNPEQTMTMKMQ